MKFRSASFVVLVVVLLFGAASTARAEIFFAYLHSAQEVPTNASTATGFARIVVNESTGAISFTVQYNGLLTSQTAAHIHAPAAIGVNAGVAINLGVGGGQTGTIFGTGAITPTQLLQLRQGLGYVNVHTSGLPGGEIRGQLGKKRPVDFDGDGRQDYSVLKFPGGGGALTFWNQNSTQGTQVFGTWGNSATDFPAPGDYDGDGRDDFALFRAGAVGAQSEFWIIRSSDSTVRYFAWGRGGDVQIARDYDGDGITDPATFRRSAAVGGQATWYIRQSTDGTARVVGFGTTGSGANNQDFPVPGDYDGDGKYDIAVYRAGTLTPTNTYIVLRSSDSSITFTAFGNFVTDWILPGDYDGDGKFDFAVARTGGTPTTPMVWWTLQSSNSATRTQIFGISSDFPVQGDYDGDSRADIAIVRAGATAGAAHNFWVLNSLSNTATIFQWGVNPDFPIARFDSR